MPRLLASCHTLGNGCGHSLLGAQSGTLASQNYPGTYPSNSWCKWRLRVPERRTLRLLFGDFDIENSPGCSNGSVVISDQAGKPIIGKFSVLLSLSSVCQFLLKYLLMDFFMLHVIIYDCTHRGDAIQLTHWLKRQTTSCYRLNVRFATSCQFTSRGYRNLSAHQMKIGRCRR